MLGDNIWTLVATLSPGTTATNVLQDTGEIVLPGSACASSFAKPQKLDHPLPTYLHVPSGTVKRLVL